MSKDAFQGKYILGDETKVGDPRRKHEDRVFSGEVHSAGGNNFIVGIVADGVGSAEAGERGAQLAVDTVIGVIQDTQDDSIPDMIERALHSANRAVYEDNQINEADGLTTLTVAVIYMDRCFIGNVGDSRAYWIQGGDKGKMLQLTRDHNYYNIHGGTDPDSDDASVLVNAIGRKSDVYVDLGFYLSGERVDADQALRLGLNGLPLKPGDSIMLCSDGLIKTDPMGARYATDAEIVNAIRTEYETKAAVVKMVSAALGRRPDDNVSAVTIQYLTPDIRGKMKASTERVKLRQKITRVGASIFALAALGIIAVLGFQLSQKPQQVFLTLTPIPTMTATQPIDPGKARVDQVNGSGANVSLGQFLDTGTSILAGDGGVQILVGEQSGRAGVIYAFGNSVMELDFSEKMMPLLQTGAMYVQPGNGIAEVYFSQWTDLKATVSGSRMIVEIQGNDIWIYCFEGTCQLFAGLKSQVVPVGSKQLYRTATGLWEDIIEMTYDETWAWNIKCNFCMFGIIATPTPTATPVQSQPTKKPDDSTYGSGFNWEDRFASLEMERERMATKGNSFFSIVFTVFLVFISNNKNLYLRRVVSFTGLFTLIMFFLTKL